MAKYGVADLVMTSGEGYVRTFTREVQGVAQPWTGRTTRLQMRTPFGDALLVELTAFLEIDAVDATKLMLVLPASWTAKMAPEGRWDLLSVSGSDVNDAFRLPRPVGRILVLQGATSSV